LELLVHPTNEEKGHCNFEEVTVSNTKKNRYLLGFFINYTSIIKMQRKINKLYLLHQSRINQSIEEEDDKEETYRP
jgi:hypothetical protein